MMKSFSASSFVLGVMAGALLTAAWFFGDDIGLNFTTPSSALSTTPESSSQGSGAITILNQPSGDSVMVESVTVPPSGVWVAVLEVNGRDLGNVLGATRVVGSHTNVEVSLLRPTEPNRSYAVKLYRDDNNGEFDPSVNSVYVDFDTGTRVVAYFTTTE